MKITLKGGSFSMLMYRLIKCDMYSTVLASSMSTLLKLELFGKGTLIEKIPPLDQPVGKPVVHFIFCVDD